MAARPPPVSYSNTVKLAPTSPEVSPTGDEPPQSAEAPAGQATRRRPMESRADPTILYLHPDGKYELKRYALARGPKVKVHDLLLEALEEWAERKGIAAPMRVPSERSRRS